MIARSAIVALLSALLLTGFHAPAHAAATHPLDALGDGPITAQTLALLGALDGRPATARALTPRSTLDGRPATARALTPRSTLDGRPATARALTPRSPLDSGPVTARALVSRGAPPAVALGLRGDRRTAAELDERIAAASRRLEVVVEQYNDSREDLRDTQRRTAQLGAQLGPLTRELERRQTLLDGLMANTYQRTRTGPTVALFASDQPHEFVDKLLVLHQLASEEQRAAHALQEARAKVDGTRAMLDALSAQQRRQQIQLTTRKATVEGEIVVLKQMRAVAYGGGSRYADPGDLPAPEYVPGPAGRVVAFAINQIGKPYRWGADGPRSYDCSGLTLAAWRRAGVHLPHNAARQYASAAHIDRNDLRPGDLVFFYGPISHVGIYIGGGQMVHAPEFGENVRVASIDSQPITGFARPT
ncbi:NlpC/P60 family protein [Couchioplanes caeruleus subsp. azureus]|uniref:C40 family peptidase n=1 Tax=Couchioplanes caeruleus TaxID=56438 RepID=UPI00167008C9